MIRSGVLGIVGVLVLVVAVWLAAPGPRVANALKGTPGGGGGGGTTLCLTCTDCCSNRGYTNGTLSCHWVDDGEGGCSYCQGWGDCRVPVCAWGCWSWR